MKAAKPVIVIQADLKVHNVMKMDNAYVMKMLKDEHVIVARKINTTDIKAVWIVHLVITWFKMQSIVIDES